MDLKNVGLKKIDLAGVDLKKIDLKNVDRRVLVAANAAIGAIAIGGAAAAGIARAAKAHAGHSRVGQLKLSDGSKVRVLKSGGVYQSATFLGDRWAEPVFQYYRSFDTMFEAEPKMLDAHAHGIDHVLMLGGGGFAYPKHALTERAGLTMDVVEIDPSVTRAARRKFFLDKLEAEVGRRLHVFCDDALTFLALTSRSTVRYDAIVNDCFVGKEPVRDLLCMESLALAKSCMNADGLYLANIVSTEEGANVSFLRDATATALKVFRHVWVFQTSDEELGGEDNYLLIASDGNYEFSEAVPFDRSFPGRVMRRKRSLNPFKKRR